MIIDCPFLKLHIFSFFNEKDLYKFYSTNKYYKNFILQNQEKLITNILLKCYNYKIWKYKNKTFSIGNNHKIISINKYKYFENMFFIFDLIKDL